MSRHAVTERWRHRAERTPILQSLLRTRSLMAIAGIALPLGAGTIGSAGAEISHDTVPTAAWPTQCPSSDQAKLNAWQEKTRQAIDKAAAHPSEYKYRLDTAERLAAKHQLPVVDTTPVRKQLEGVHDPHQAVAIANNYTVNTLGITTSAGSFNQETSGEVDDLLLKISEVPKSFIEAAHVDAFVVQSPRPTELSPDGKAVIEWEKDDPTDAGTVHFATGRVDESFGHELHHGTDRWYSWRMCGVANPTTDPDIEAANPAGFQYSDYPLPGQWEGVCVRQYAATSPFEDSASTANVAISPQTVTDWEVIDTRPVTDKVGVIAMRYEATQPGLGEWLIDNMSTQRAADLAIAQS